MLLNSARRPIRYRMSVYKVAMLLIRSNRWARGRDNSPTSEPVAQGERQLASPPSLDPRSKLAPVVGQHTACSRLAWPGSAGRFVGRWCA